MGAGLVAAMSARFSLKTLMYTGSVIMAVGLIGASFANSVWHLILTQGKNEKVFIKLLHALTILKALFLGLDPALVSGALHEVISERFTLLTISLVSNAFMPFVPMWWFKYRGIATGIIFSGAGLMGLVTPIAIERSLAAVGFRWTLRILSLFTLVLCLGSSFAVRTRYLPDASGTMRVSFTGKDFRFLVSRKFIILGACVLFQGLGYFIPNLFIQRKSDSIRSSIYQCIENSIFFNSAYALSVGVPEQTSTTLVSVMNAMTVVGQLLLGHISDRFGYWKALVISSTAASLSTFLLWRMAGSSLTTIFVYVVIYACFGAGFTTCFPAMVADIADDPNQFVLISGKKAVEYPSLFTLFIFFFRCFHDVTWHWEYCRESAGVHFPDHIFKRPSWLERNHILCWQLPVLKCSFRGSAGYNGHAVPCLSFVKYSQ